MKPNESIRMTKTKEKLCKKKRIRISMKMRQKKEMENNTWARVVSEANE